MKLLIQKGSTSKLARIFIQDSTLSDGSGLTGLLYNSSGLTAYYIKESQSTATAITLATMTVGTWATGGFKEIDATNLPGVYEIGLPNACLTTNDSVLVMLKGATNMAPVVMEIQLVSFDPNDSVRMGLTSIPNASAGSAGGLPTDSTGKTSFNDISTSQVNAEVVDALITDTYAEPGSVPSSNSSIKDKINWLFTLARNKLNTTSSLSTLRNDADSADISTSSVSDNGTTFIRGEWT